MNLRKMFFFIAVLGLCMGIAKAEQSEKPDLQFSLSGGTSQFDGQFQYQGEFIFAQNWKSIWLQTAVMAETNSMWERYGTSLGAGFELLDHHLGLYGFFDAMYQDGRLYGQAGPSLSFKFPRISFLGYFRTPITDPYLIQESSSKIRFWTQADGYYYGFDYTKTWSKAVEFWGVETRLIPFNFLRLNADYKNGEHGLEAIQAGASLKLFGFDLFGLPGIAVLNGQYQRYSVGPNVQLTPWGEHEDYRIGLQLNFGSQAESFSDFSYRKIVQPQYPIVIKWTERKQLKEKIADILTGTISVDKEEACVNEPFHFFSSVSGGCDPLQMQWDFGDGNFSSQRNPSHSYNQAGKYCISFTVTDDCGYSIERCLCIEVIECQKEPELYELVVEFCEGVKGEPGPGTYTFESGTEVHYEYSLIKGYKQLAVTIDGISAAEIGRIIMDKNHYVKVCASKKEDCIPPQILQFTADKEVVKPGEEVTLTWKTKNANAWTINGESLPLNGSKKFYPMSNTTFTGIAASDCPPLAKARVEVKIKDCEPVKIETFTANPDVVEPGNTTTISWNVENANHIKLMNVSTGEYWNVDPSGSKNFTIENNTEFKLQAKNECSEAYSQLNVRVEEECIPVVIDLDDFVVKVNGIVSPTAQPGDLVRVEWKQAENATEIIVYKDGTIINGNNELSGSREFQVTEDDFDSTWIFDYDAINKCSSEHKQSSVLIEPGEDEDECEEGYSNASQCFTLSNSSPATEEAWVNTYVEGDEWVFLSKDDAGYNSQCVTAAKNAEIVLLKSGTQYTYVLNVKAGQQLCTCNGKDISHVSYFTCVR